MHNAIVEKKERMTQSHRSLAREFAVSVPVVPTRLLDRIHVEYYGASKPSNQIASIIIPEARVFCW